MLIVQLEAPHRLLQGDSLYRTVQPCAAVAAYPGVFAISGSWHSPVCQRAALAADVLILCQAVDADFLPVLAARRRALRPTVFEINDDFTAMQPWNRVAAFCQNPLMMQITLQQARQAQALQFSSADLQRRFGHLHRRSLVLPNQLVELPALPQKPSQAAGGACVTLGFGGSPGHREDVRWIVPRLQALLQATPQIQFRSMVQPEMRTLFDPLPPAQCAHVDPGDMASYRRFLTQLDVGLAPLLPTPFNDGRSDVKFLETAAAGAAFLGSDAPAYRQSVVDQDNGLLFADLDAFSAKLKGLIAQPHRRAACVQRARTQIAAQRLEHQHAARRCEFLASLLSPSQRQRASGQAAEKFDALVAAHANVDARGPRYARLAPGPFELALLAGLQASDPRQAQGQFLEAGRLQDNYLPLLYRGQRQADPAQGLKLLGECVRQQPRSCAAWYGIARRLEQRGERAAAARAYAQLVRLAPEWEAAQQGSKRLRARGADAADVPA